jgi:hypothetical protein
MRTTQITQQRPHLLFVVLVEHPACDLERQRPERQPQRGLGVEPPQCAEVGVT